MDNRSVRVLKDSNMAGGEEEQGRNWQRKRKRHAQVSLRKNLLASQGPV